MKIEQSINIPNVYHIFADDSVLYVFSYSPGQGEIFCFNPRSLKMISRFAFQYDANPLISPCVDENCVYLPSNDGQIIGVDKFSGDAIVSIDLGLMTPLSNLQQNDSHIYALCGVPISGKNKIDTNSACITANDKKSGKKRFQTQSFFSSLLFTVNCDIWAIDNKTLIKLDEHFDIENKIPISFVPSFAPFVTKDYVILCSDKGLVEIMDHQLNSVARLLIGSTSTVSPILHDNKLLWLTHGKLLSINPFERKTKSITRYEFVTRSPGFVLGNNIYTTTSTGRFARIHTQTGQVDEVYIIDKPLGNPVVVDDIAFVYAEGQLHQICLNAS